MNSNNRIRSNHIVTVLSLATIMFAGTQFLLALAPTVALVTKVVKEVVHKPEDKDWHRAKVGQPLSDGDLLKTGKRSIAIVKFADNNVLRIRARSELRIFASKSDDGAFSKNVDVARGKMGFDVTNQENEQFTFTSPTSVASIRGSNGSFASNPADGDTLIMLSGDADLMSQLTGETQPLSGGKTGIVDAETGEIEVRDSSEDEQSDAQASNAEPNVRELRMRTMDGRNFIIEFDDQRP
ncbi:MAG: FecR domain-containing protein [Bacteroidota bacterium]